MIVIEYEMRDLQEPSIDSIDIAFHCRVLYGCSGFLKSALLAHLGKHELYGVYKLYVAQDQLFVYELKEFYERLRWRLWFLLGMKVLEEKVFHECLGLWNLFLAEDVVTWRHCFYL